MDGVGAARKARMDEAADRDARAWPVPDLRTLAVRAIQATVAFTTYEADDTREWDRRSRDAFDANQAFLVELQHITGIEIQLFEQLQNEAVL